MSGRVRHRRLGHGRVRVSGVAAMMTLLLIGAALGVGFACGYIYALSGVSL